MITPQFLNKGDKISIIATARKVKKLDINRAINFILINGFEVELGNNLFSKNHQFAGTDEQRLEDFQNAISHSTSKAILFARGGYGSIRILDRIDFSPLLNNPKWLCGYSDITIFHSHLHNLGIKTIHSTMALSSFNKTSFDLLFNILKNKFPLYEFRSHKLNRNGFAKGELIGGNLSILYSLLGSDSDINTDGKILFIEDLDEYLYHIERMMFSLKRNGKLKNLKGMIVGSMLDMKDNVVAFGRTAEKIIFDIVAEYDYPVCFNFPSGHGKENMPLILGNEVELRVDSKCVLQFI